MLTLQFEDEDALANVLRAAPDYAKLTAIHMAHYLAKGAVAQPVDCGNTPYDEGPFTLVAPPLLDAAAPQEAPSDARAVLEQALSALDEAAKPSMEHDEPPEICARSKVAAQALRTLLSRQPAQPLPDAGVPAKFEVGAGCEMSRSCRDASYCLGHCKTGRPDAGVLRAGISTLQNVIECLRSEASYVDEEGEATDRLEELLKAIRASLSGEAGQRECCNENCGWRGRTDRMLGAIGPLCPECGEVTEDMSDTSSGEAGQPVAECRWSIDGEDSAVYETSCGNAFFFEEGDATTNGAKFCMYCGGALIDAAIAAQEAKP